MVIARCGESLDWIYDLVPGVDFYLYQKCSGRKRRVDRSALAARLPAGSTLAARQRFAEHFHTLEWGHRPSQALSSADQISASLY